ncbi:hypothetical protein [Dankookia sp. P2]|uniref:hypothetical protein n=1 Tax=Dankookia sp. P2 TaxID=3423955 RepID=UPI003D67D61D
MPHTDNGSAAAKPEAPDPGPARAAARTIPRPELYVLTVRADSGQVVWLESLDAAGARADLSPEDRARFAEHHKAGDLAAVMEQAFEAGIACVLGNVGGEDGGSAEEADLRRMLLRSLIARSPAARFLDQAALGRVALATLLRQAATAPAEAGGTTAPRRRRGPAGRPQPSPETLGGNNASAS